MRKSTAGESVRGCNSLAERGREASSYNKKVVADDRTVVREMLWQVQLERDRDAQKPKG